jgi:hypothetical protein
VSADEGAALDSNSPASTWRSLVKLEAFLGAVRESPLWAPTKPDWTLGAEVALAMESESAPTWGLPPEPFWTVVCCDERASLAILPAFICEAMVKFIFCLATPQHIVEVSFPEQRQIKLSSHAWLVACGRGYRVWLSVEVGGYWMVWWAGDALGTGEVG